MKKLILAFILFLCISNTHAQFAGGDGSLLQPYQISTVNQLDSIRYFSDNHFALLNDLDIGSWINSHPQSDIRQHGWKPIDPEFSGSFNGQGFSLTGFSINRPQDSACGLFAALSSESHVYNLKIEFTELYMGTTSGALAGLGMGQIENCSVTGQTIYGSGYFIGGLIGYIDSATILSSYESCNIACDSFYVGGLFGVATNSSIESCQTNGTINAYALIGGIAGIAVNSNFTNCYYIGNIYGEQQCGGIVGNCNKIQLNNCYADGEINVNSSRLQIAFSGGLVGLSNNSSIQNCYATNHVISELNNILGGLLGYSLGDTIQDCYATGRIRGYSATGGFVGFIYDYTVVERCIAANPSVTASIPSQSGRVIGFAGSSLVRLSDNFAYIGMLFNGHTTIGSLDDQNGEDISVGELLNEDTYTQAPLEWNFASGSGDWKMPSNGCLPILAWQEDNSTEDCQFSFIQKISDNKLAFKIYPNPTNDYVIIETGSPKITGISLYNSIGKLVKSISSFPNQNEVKIDLHGLNQGIYILNIQTKEGSCTHKIIKK